MKLKNIVMIVIFISFIGVIGSGIFVYITTNKIVDNYIKKEFMQVVLTKEDDKCKYYKSIYKYNGKFNYFTVCE